MMVFHIINIEKHLFHYYTYIHQMKATTTRRAQIVVRPKYNKYEMQVSH